MEPDPLTGVTTIVVRPEYLELLDEVGDPVATLDYMSTPADAIGVLNVVFGEAPVDEAYDGGNHRPDGIMHTWDDLVIDERFYDEARREESNLYDPVWPRFAAYFDGPSALGITLRTVQGHQAGNSWESVASDPEFDEELWTCVGTPIEAWEIETSRGTSRATVVVTANDDDGTIKWIGAPEMEADGCA